MAIALLIIALGIIFLLRNLGVVTVGFWNLFWPGIVIVMGLTLILKRQRHRAHWWDFFDNQSSGDWERWGKELGMKIEEMGKNIETHYRNHPEEWGREFGKRMEHAFKKFFEGTSKSHNAVSRDTKETNSTKKRETI
ncbi:MAG: DUF5668 domain-containing protein [bacterium]|nr:DUF5668 domain-containing protein [bacterium]